MTQAARHVIFIILFLFNHHFLLKYRESDDHVGYGDNSNKVS